MRPTIILASASPHRRELLHALGLSYTVSPSAVDETLRLGEPPTAEVRRLATAKALAQEAREGDVAIAADTLVVLGETVLGKPATPEQASDMLRRLRGREHRVVTGVALINHGDVCSDVRVTRVVMREYSDEEIAAYVATGEPLDKAGGYAIQDPILRPAQWVDGCYCNVVGLPAGLLVSMLRSTGYPVGDVRPLAQCAGCPDWPLHAR